MGSPAADDQSAVIAFLADPHSHAAAAGGVERIETHCSIVFLAGDRAYKLKRAIRYSSLDYTTLASREIACEAELRLNRRTAAELYLGVRSINRDPTGGLAFDGPGAALDYVVMMRRFARVDLFDRMADDGRLSPELMRALGQAVARLHLAAEITPEFGGAEAIRRVIANNERELGLVAPALDGVAVETLSGGAHQALEAVAALLDRRRAEGKVRRCHGDLRLANICLWRGRPTLFDCIEFSDEIGCVDVLYDLAFLLMDLDLRGRGDLGNAVFNAWMDLAPETDGLRALPLFLALRAATRSYALAGGARRQTDPEQAARLLASARRHVHASIDLLRPRRPVLICLGGDSVSGRDELATMFAARTAPAPGARIVHLTPVGEAAWRDANDVLAAGCSVVIEGAFTDAAERRRAGDMAARLAVPSYGFFLGTPPAGSDLRPWRTLDPGGDPGGGALAALASAAQSLIAAGA
jgi:hypothetical protein